MRKQFKRLVAAVLVGVLTLQTPGVALADSEKVVTLGADLTQEQRKAMLEFFGVTEDEVTILEVNNQEERKYLEGIATEAEIGTHTYSCAYIMPTNTSKINVKTAHLTWVSTSMIANTLVTAGIDSCDVVAAAPRDVSGTGALTGIIKAYEKVTDEKLDEQKTELAMEELYQTAELGSQIGQDEAAAVMNEVKSQVLKDEITDEAEVKDVVNEVAEHYNVELSDQQTQEVANLMTDIGKQDYDYSAIEQTMGNLQDKLVDNMDGVTESLMEAAEENKAGILAALGRFFSGLFHAIGRFFGNFFKSEAERAKEEELEGEDIEIEDIDDESILNELDESALGIEPTENAGNADDANTVQSDTIDTSAGENATQGSTTDTTSGDNTTQSGTTDASTQENTVQDSNSQSNAGSSDSNVQQDSFTSQDGTVSSAGEDGATTVAQ